MATTYYDTFDDEKALEAKPETEQELAKYQRLFLDTRDPQYWQKMLEVIYPYTRSLVLKQNRGKDFLEEEEVNEITSISALQFMQRYFVEPKFEIKASFAGLLRFKVREIIKIKKKQKYVYNSGYLLSLNDFLGDDNSTELGETEVHSVTMTSADEDSLSPDAFIDMKSVADAAVHLISEMEVLVTDEDSTVDSKMVALASFYLIMKIKGIKNKHQKEMFIKYFKLGVPEDNVLDSLLLHLKKRISSSIDN